MPKGGLKGLTTLGYTPSPVKRCGEQSAVFGSV
jgi:hypothetical protein